jgi:hypothetical protein
MNPRSEGKILKKNSSTQIVASILGVFVGLAGVEHGIFETFQGNVAPDDIVMYAIGPEQQFWEFGTEQALTIVPNFLITGILAIILGLLVTVWAIKFIDKKFGSWILMLLSVALWLFGGGFAPLFLAILATITAIKINSPLTWWEKHLSIRTRERLAKLWRWSLAIVVILFVVSVETAIFGYPLLWLFDANTTYSIQFLMALVMLAIIPVCMVSAFARDIIKRNQ